MNGNRNKWEQVVKLVNELKVDATKTYTKGNRSAGLRLRKGLMQLRELAKECRAETLNL
ncbi:histone H1 [Candidatus Pacearchaeota archaeon]|nr:histone H1 [Candidatus Pacearchaeota archaeon]|tara:strand:+ start:1599 stop:1775 length:177 start_codon:yes stop_codon:yes gene_type:complete